MMLSKRLINTLMMVGIAVMIEGGEFGFVENNQPVQIILEPGCRVCFTAQLVVKLIDFDQAPAC